MVFCNSNNVLAVGSEKLIKYYNVQEKTNPIQLVELEFKVVTLAFQRKVNNILISCCENGYVQFWDIESKKNIKVIELYNTIPLMLSPNGKFIVYKDHQNYIKLCDLEYPEVVYSFNGSQIQENVIQFSKDEEKVAFGLQVLDISGIQNKVDDNIKCIEISPDGVHYAIGQKQKISICDSKGGIGVDKLKGHTGAVNTIAYSFDAMQLVSVGDDKRVIYWDIFYCKIINQHNHHQNNVLSVAISEDKQYIASGDINGIIILQRIEPWEIICQISLGQKINSLSFCIDQCLASGDANKQIKLWKINQQQTMQSQQGFQDYHTFNGHTDEVRCVTFSKDGKQLASCSNDKTIRVWCVDEKSYLFSLNGHKDHVINIKFTRNNQIWSCSKDNTIRLWDTEQQIMISKLDSNNSNLKSFALNPDDQYLLSLSENQSIKLWNLNGFNYKEEQIKYQKAINAIALSPDGKTIAYSGDNNLIQLWDVNTKQPINHLQLEGIIVQLLFQGSNYLICSVKINNKDLMIKLDLLNYKKEILGEGSKVAISVDEKYLAYAKNKTLNIIPDNNPQVTKEAKTEIQILCFSPKDDILASISNRNILIWNYKTGTQIQTITSNNVIKLCSFTTNGEWFTFNSGDAIIYFQSTEKFGQSTDFILQPQKKYQNKSKNCKKILTSNQYLIVLFDDNEIKVLDPTLNEIPAQSSEWNQILNIAISSNGENLVILKKDFSIEFIEIENFKGQDQQYKANVFCFYSNGEKLVTGCGKKIEIINLYNSKKNQNQSKTLYIEIKQIILSQTNSKIAIAGEKQIIIYDSNLTSQTQIQFQNKSIQSITFSSGESYLAYIYKDELKLWDLMANKDDSSRFKDFSKKPTGLIQFFNVICNLLIVTIDQLVVFDLETKKEKYSFNYDRQEIMVIAISKNNQTIAAGFEDGKIRLWNLSDLKSVNLDSGSKGIICLDFHPKSEELASAGVDNIKIWSIKEKCAIYQFKTPDNSKITCIKYHPTKNQLVLSCNDGKMYFWLTAWPKPFMYQYLIEDEILNYSISSDGQKLAIQSLSDKNISIIDVPTGIIKLIFPIRVQQVGKNFTFCSIFTLFNQLIFEVPHVIKLYLIIKIIIKQRQGNKLAYFSDKDLQLNVYDIQNNSFTTYQNYKNKINTIDFSKDEKQLIIGYFDGTIQFFKDENQSPICQSSDNSKINQLTFYDTQLIQQKLEQLLIIYSQLNIDQKIQLKKITAEVLNKKDAQSRNAIRIKVLEENKIIVKKAGSQFQILDKDFNYSLATSDQINKSLINIENLSVFWKYRIGYIEQNPKCRTFPIIISKINQESKFTLQNNIQINEYFDRQFF